MARRSHTLTCCVTRILKCWYDTGRGRWDPGEVIYWAQRGCQRPKCSTEEAVPGEALAASGGEK